MENLFTKMALLFLALTAFVCAVNGSPWNRINDPSLFSNAYNYQLSSLPTRGTLTKLPWSDTYWPSFQGGIAHRWYSDNPEDFRYKTYSLQQLQQMSLSQLKQLSPAEKYDIYCGRYDYPTVKSEWKRTDPGDKQWEGLCHGWAPASLHYEEPDAVTLTNQDGIQVPFGSSDVKALLTYYVGEYDESISHFIGERCDYDLEKYPRYANSRACKDINAGSFHVALTNQLSADINTGFVIDRDRSIEVWNQPVCSFTSQVVQNLGSTVQVKTSITYASETPPSWNTHEPDLITEEYTYWLELDRFYGKIVGGTHQTWDRPDFAVLLSVNPFSGYFSSLKTIYQASVNLGVSERSDESFDDMLTSLPNHHELQGGNGTIQVENYSNDYRESWSIVLPATMHSLRIHFDQFSTERCHDKVKIYEGVHREGALVAVLHGNEIPQDVVLNGVQGAYVVFTSDSCNTDLGFELHWTAV